ncbi:MAG: heparan-alpha-glucosaminide N-acetyltransferase domain-containing protein [Myxococcota bacterium]
MTTPTARRRVFMVDVLRIIASLQMINGHTLDSLLLPAWETGPGFDRYSWYRGLVSVAFLLVAGMAYYLATIRRFDDHKADPDAVRRRIRRGIDLILIGYLLRFPWGIWSSGAEYAARQWFYFLNCGVLQCIGVTLLALESMTLFFSRPRYVVGGAFALAVTLVGLAPWLDTLTVEGPFRFLMNYVSHRGGSLFPVAPWGAYMLGGVVFGAWVLPRGAETPLWSRLLRLGVMWLVFSALYQWTKGADLPFVTSETTFSARPSAMFDRLAGITVFLSVLAVVCHPIRRLPRVFAVVSGETLAVYVIHLVLLFHPPFRLANRLGHSSWELWPALVVSAGMIVSTISLTLLWHEQKKRGWLRQARKAVVDRVLRTAAPSAK